MKVFKKIIPFLLAFAIAFSFAAVPAHAVVAVEWGTSDFASWLFGWLEDGTHMALNQVRAVFDSDMCPFSPDLNGRHSMVVRDTVVNGVSGNYYVCEYCGRYAGDFVAPAYSDYVSSLPASGYNSAGALIWHPAVSDINSCLTYLYKGANATSGSYTLLSVKDSSLLQRYDEHSFLYSYSPSSAIGFHHFYYRIDVKNFPISGAYRVLISSAFTAKVTASDNIYDVIVNYEDGSYAHYDSSTKSSDYLKVDSPALSYSGVTHISFQGFTPVFEVIPDAAVSGDVYNIDSRPSGITGDYGIIGDNGQISKVDTTTIINETNSTIYNPVTGETHNMSDWSYNYTDRSYTVTTTTGDTITITYGDENITIVEGDTIYNVYYIIQGSGGDSGNTGGGTTTPGEDHKHTYTSSVTRAASCTVTGERTYTCTAGDDTYTESIPALGHNWQIKEQVSTEYGENGEIITEGYAIYRCSRCGEERRSTDGKVPDSDDGEEKETIWDKIVKFLGSLLKRLFSMLESLLGKILDALLSFLDFLIGVIEKLLSKVLDWLISLAELITDKFGRVVEMVLGWFDEIPSLFTGFMDFLTAMFSFLPEEMMMLLTFGLACVIFIGIIKAIRGR